MKLTYKPVEEIAKLNIEWPFDNEYLQGIDDTVWRNVHQNTYQLTLSSIWPLHSELTRTMYFTLDEGMFIK